MLEFIQFVAMEVILWNTGSQAAINLGISTEDDEFASYDRKMAHVTLHHSEVVVYEHGQGAFVSTRLGDFGHSHFSRTL